jgi:hypothetical protein
MDLLEAFVRFAPEDVYENLTHLDRHNVASAHGTLRNAVFKRTREKIAYYESARTKFTVSKEDIVRSRQYVNEATEALLHEFYMLEDLTSGRLQFKEMARKFVTLCQRIRPSTDVLEEIKEDYEMERRYCRAYVLEESKVFVFNVFLMGLDISWRFECGNPMTLRLRIDEFGRAGGGMDISWNKDLSLGIAIIKFINLPYILNEYSVDTFSEDSILRWCFVHGKLEADLKKIT